MTGSTLPLGRAFFGMALVGSLGFGATQAFAVPDFASRRLPWCNPGDTSGYYAGVCMRACQRQGYDYGYCQQEGPNPDNGTCACANL